MSQAGRGIIIQTFALAAALLLAALLRIDPVNGESGSDLAGEQPDAEFDRTRSDGGREPSSERRLH